MKYSFIRMWFDFYQVGFGRFRYTASINNATQKAPIMDEFASFKMADESGNTDAQEFAIPEA